MKVTRKLIFLLLSLAIIMSTVMLGVAAAAPSAPRGQTTARPGSASPYVAGEVIVKYGTGLSLAARREAVAPLGLVKKDEMPGRGLELYRLPRGLTVEDAVRRLEANPTVEFAQPNFLKQPCYEVPDDPGWGDLWGLENTEYSYVDLDILNAWDTYVGLTGDPDAPGDPSVIVAVLDTGVDISHPDLSANIWSDPDEADGIPGEDDDSDGWADDFCGWDFIGNDNTVFDTGEYWVYDRGDAHGTHVAGTIAAVMNNMTGVAGVAPGVSIMPLKFIGPMGGSSWDEVRGIEFAMAHGARIINASFGGSFFDRAEYEAIADFGDYGGVFIAAAGNDGANNDDYEGSPHYPSSYDLANIIAVAAVDYSGALAEFSNYGAESVDVGAPGVDILSTVPSQKPPAGNAAVEMSCPWAPYDAVVWGFGAEDLSDPDEATEAVARAMSFLDIGLTDPVLVVVDAGETGEYDVGLWYMSCLAGAGYENVDYWDVWAEGDPLTVGTMTEYAAVVWAASYKPLDDPDDLDLLAAYLDAGTDGAYSKLFLSGADAFYEIEGNYLLPYYLLTLHAGENPYPDWGSAHSGLAGIGGSYTGASYSSFQGEHEDFFQPWNPQEYLGGYNACQAVLSYTPPGSYGEACDWFSGTSMAAPHVSGVAALLRGAFPDASAGQVKDAILDSVTPLADLDGVTVTGGMVSASEALAELALLAGNPETEVYWPDFPAVSYQDHIHGQAMDAAGAPTGIARVTLSIYSDGFYWDPQADAGLGGWVGTFVEFEADLGSSTIESLGLDVRLVYEGLAVESWDYPTEGWLSAETYYTLTATAYDVEDNPDYSPAEITFLYDDTLPEATLIHPHDGEWTNTLQPLIDALVRDPVADEHGSPSGLVRVSFLFTDGDLDVTTIQTLDVSSTGDGSYVCDWGDVELPRNGDWSIGDQVEDLAGNVSEAWSLVSVDTFPPVVSVSGSCFSTPPEMVTGMASDSAGAVVSGVDGVEVSIQDSDGFYWNGVDAWYEGAGPTWLAASPVEGAPDNWQYPTAGWLVDPGIYRVNAQAWDLAGNMNDPPAWATFTLDTTGPTVEIVSPSPSELVSARPNFTARASDAELLGRLGPLRRLAPGRRGGPPRLGRQRSRHNHLGRDRFGHRRRYLPYRDDIRAGEQLLHHRPRDRAAQGLRHGRGRQPQGGPSPHLPGARQPLVGPVEQLLERLGVHRLLRHLDDGLGIRGRHPLADGGGPIHGVGLRLR